VQSVPEAAEGRRRQAEGGSQVVAELEQQACGVVCGRVADWAC
jgi:hypothetical protein